MMGDLSMVTTTATNDSLSSILGWVSIACWIVVYSPQIYENYVQQSGEGLSITFILIWLLGDLCNLSGAILADLLPTVIILGVYYSLCDTTLLVQVYYYRWKASKSQVSSFHEHDEESPLLQNGDTRVQDKIVPAGLLFLRYCGALFFVIVTGVIAWWISSKVELEEKPSRHHSRSITWVIQILGWSSAVLFLGARIPQIIKNSATKCEGLAPALFFFSILGNTTYALSICAKSMDKAYLITNASWLAGSGLTVFLDLIVLFQFYYYRRRSQEQ